MGHGWCTRTITRPLAEIAVFEFNIEAWLDDLAALIGIEPRHRVARRVRFPHFLWYLGDVQVTGTQDLAPVFVARAWKHAPRAEVSAVLGDPIWPRPGVVLRLLSGSETLPGAHTLRGIEELIQADETGVERLDAAAFDRVLRGIASRSNSPEEAQFLRGNRLKLPHFASARELPDEVLDAEVWVVAVFVLTADLDDPADQHELHVFLSIEADAAVELRRTWGS